MSTMTEMLEELYKMTGRADLVHPTTYADLGGLAIINQAQRYLDRKMHGNHGRRRYFEALDAGEYTKTIPLVRAIEEVWCYNTEKRWELSRESLNWFRTNYTEPWNSMTRGTPKHYAHTIYGLARDVGTPSNNQDASSAFIEISSSEETYGQIVIGPPSDEDINLEVFGKFYTTPLSADDPISWWSALHPEVLLMATARQLEIRHRNTQGVNDWNSAINEYLIDIDHDDVEDETNDLTSLGGPYG